MFDLPGCRAFALVLLVATLAVPSPSQVVSGQESDPQAGRALKEELDRLIPQLERLRMTADLAENRERERRLRENHTPVDTFALGPFRVISLPDQRELAEEVMLGAWKDLRPLVDGSEELLEPWSFLVHYYWNRDRTLLPEDSLIRKIDVPRQFPRAHLERKAVEIVGNTLLKALPKALEMWSGGQIRVATDRLPWVARELIATPSTAVRQCYRGELEGCTEALGLNGAEGGWDRWYSAEERRYFVQTRMGRGSARQTALWEGCVLSGMDDACSVLLRGIDPVFPFSTEARASLLGHALWTGGTGAFHRLRTTEAATPMDRLSAAAGMPFDSLLASWRNEVLEARPSSWAGFGRSPMAILFWVLFFGALAVRSTRCRLG